MASRPGCNSLLQCEWPFPGFRASDGWNLVDYGAGVSWRGRVAQGRLFTDRMHRRGKYWLRERHDPGRAEPSKIGVTRLLLRMLATVAQPTDAMTIQCACGTAAVIIASVTALATTSTICRARAVAPPRSLSASHMFEVTGVRARMCCACLSDLIA